MEQEKRKRIAGWRKSIVVIVFWILVWQLIVFIFDQKSGMSMGGNLLVASPAETIKALSALVQTADFWKAVGFSFAKIACGFFLALAAGVLFAALASVSGVVRALLNPLLHLMKAVPVASFIILALFWLSSSRNLSVLISFLMVLPVVYTNVLQGIDSTEKELLEMATVFRVSFGKRLCYIYVPAVLPYFVSACSVGLGFSFKSGIAAEIIGLPQHSIGERLYEAKLYLMTEELFAWTVVIVLVSVFFEKAVMLLIRLIARGLTGGVWQAGPAEKLAEDARETVISAESEQSAAEGNLQQEEAAAQAGRSMTERTLSAGLGQVHDIAADLAEELPANPTSEAYGLFDVTKCFEEKTVLDGITLELLPGRTLALMGPSGCGKSTVGKLLLGLLQEDAGQVKRPKRMGAVFQEDRLCREFDAVTNIALVTGNRKAAEKALAEVGLEGIGRKPVMLLSGGMKRRVAIVRALLSDGEVLVLDEPFTGLDAASKQLAVQYVKKKLQGRCVLLITHNTEEAACLADRVVQLTREKTGESESGTEKSRRGESVW